MSPHLQWATDPAGRQYWIQGGPALGGTPHADAVRALGDALRRVVGRPQPRRRLDVGGIVTVTRVDGEQETEVLESFCETLEEARAAAVAVAAEIEAGRFEERPSQR